MIASFMRRKRIATVVQNTCNDILKFSILLQAMFSKLHLVTQIKYDSAFIFHF